MSKKKRKNGCLSGLIFFLFCIILIPILLFAYARFIEPELLTVSSYDVETKKTIKPCKIVFFTDTHFGELYEISHVENLVKKINDTNADIVIFGGDLLDNYARDREHLDLDYLREELSKIKSKAGTYAVWGNHDYGGGAVRIYEDFITSCNFRLLKNESVTLEEYGIKLIGYDDNLMGSTAPSLYHLKSNLFNVIAAHEPVVSQQIESTSENFLLSGHTHGGQVTIPFFTEKFLPKGSGKFVKGFYTKEEIGSSASLQMFTSSGIGMTRYPFRFLNPPEIAEFNFKSSK